MAIKTVRYNVYFTRAKEDRLLIRFAPDEQSLRDARIFLWSKAQTDTLPVYVKKAAQIVLEDLQKEAAAR